MTHEEKDLLIKDLCGRLPYGVKGLYYNMVMSLHMVDPFDNYHPLYCVTKSGSEYIGIDEFKPYLFPLSSMTEEQRNEYHEILYNPKHGINIDYFDWCHKNHLFQKIDNIDDTLSSIRQRL